MISYVIVLNEAHLAGSVNDDYEGGFVELGKKFLAVPLDSLRT